MNGRPTTAVGAVARAPLPSDPDQCPELDAAFAATFDAGSRALGLEPAAALRAAIEAHIRLLIAWNAAINLTAIREAAAMAREHVIDSLSALGPLTGAGIRDRPALLDIGSGAGFPGLPLGLALSASRLTLVDSVAKKARFLQVAGEAALAAMAGDGAAVPALEVVPARAETLARERRRRGGYDLVTARAVGPLAELAELGLPVLRPGGWLVAWKRTGEAFERELVEAERMVPWLGGALAAVDGVPVPELEDHRLVLIRAVRPAPALYPRPPSDRRRPSR